MFNFEHYGKWILKEGSIYFERNEIATFDNLDEGLVALRLQGNPPGSYLLRNKYANHYYQYEDGKITRKEESDTYTGWLTLQAFTWAVIALFYVCAGFLMWAYPEQGHFALSRIGPIIIVVAAFSIWINDSRHSRDWAMLLNFILITPIAAGTLAAIMNPEVITARYTTIDETRVVSLARTADRNTSLVKTTVGTFLTGSELIYKDRALTVKRNFFDPRHTSQAFVRFCVDGDCFSVKEVVESD